MTAERLQSNFRHRVWRWWRTGITTMNTASIPLCSHFTKNHSLVYIFNQGDLPSEYRWHYWHNNNFLLNKSLLCSNDSLKFCDSDTNAPWNFRAYVVASGDQRFYVISYRFSVYGNQWICISNANWISVPNVWIKSQRNSLISMYWKCIRVLNLIESPENDILTIGIRLIILIFYF